MCVGDHEHLSGVVLSAQACDDLVDDPVVLEVYPYLFQSCAVLCVDADIDCVSYGVCLLSGVVLEF